MAPAERGVSGACARIGTPPSTVSRMSTTTPQPLPSNRFARFLPRGRAWWIVAGAFAAGMLLFLLVWSGKRDEFEFYRTGGDTTHAAGPVFEPLPVPLPAGADPASGMDDRPPSREDAPRIDQHAASPDAPVAAPARPAAGTTTPAAAEAAAGVPRLVSSPAPVYPRSALRSGASGNVQLRIQVGIDGVPADVEVVSSSRNRELDRAAVQAVRRWRFAPAMQNGVPVPASVQQTISFEAQQ